MPDYVYSNEALRWRNSENGQFVSEDSVIAEMRHQVDATFSELESLTTRLYAGNITLDEWQIATAQHLSDVHLAQSMFAVGGRANMTQANYGRVGGVLRDEYRYLTKFANDISTGRVSEAQALARIRQYGKATQQSYWREYVNVTPDSQLIEWRLGVSDHCSPSPGKYGCVELAAGSPYTSTSLPTYPGAGETTCHGNCTCSLHRRTA